MRDRINLKYHSNPEKLGSPSLPTAISRMILPAGMSVIASSASKWSPSAWHRPRGGAFEFPHRAKAVKEKDGGGFTASCQVRRAFGWLVCWPQEGDAAPIFDLDLHDEARKGLKKRPVGS